jgi:hypothetical protein
VDSTGLTLSGSGAWRIEKHGTEARRSWKKLHLGVDATIGQSVAAALTGREADDSAQVTAVPSGTAESAPTQRDRHLQLIAELGRRAWQRASGYPKRARAEATISRYKRVIGDGLRSRPDERRATEVDVAIHVLNRMRELGRPNYVRVT